ncbi:MAG: aldo/keto reductase [Alphaproteobacteria bacterium]|nr:aldo/keto reductase [Alphaproteobacteria bacterium]
MNYRRLGRSGLRIAPVALGTMTMGGSLDDGAAFPLLDRALDAGINLIDMAEMADGLQANVRRTYGVSEALIGRWLKSQARDRVVIATKVGGPNDAFVLGGTNPIPHIRGGNAVLDRHHMTRALEASLTRLGTDYVDLYQFHWPDRLVPVDEQLEAAGRSIAAGKVRYLGVSNETTAGLAALLAAADRHGLPRAVAIQNQYNLLDRGFERGLQELCIAEGVGLLAFSPLAMGVLSGKYAGGALPKGSRLERFPRYRPRWGKPAHRGQADAFVALCRAAGLDPAQVALAWVRERPGVATVLSSVTTAAQLDSLIASARLTLPPALVTALETLGQAPAFA